MLKQNEGFITSTMYISKTMREERIYLILDGKIKQDISGVGPWSNDTYYDTSILSGDSINRFLYEHLSEMDTNGLGIANFMLNFNKNEAGKKETFTEEIKKILQD